MQAGSAILVTLVYFLGSAWISSLSHQPFSKIWESEIAQKYTTTMFSCSSASIFFSIFICLTSWWVSNWDFRHWYILVLWTGALLWSGSIMPPVIEAGGQTLIPSNMHSLLSVIRIPFFSYKQLLSTLTVVIYSILILGCKMWKGDCTNHLEKTCTCSMYFFCYSAGCWRLRCIFGSKMFILHFFKLHGPISNGAQIFWSGILFVSEMLAERHSSDNR